MESRKKIDLRAGYLLLEKVSMKKGKISLDDLLANPTGCQNSSVRLQAAPRTKRLCLNAAQIFVVFCIFGVLFSIKGPSDEAAEFFFISLCGFLLFFFFYVVVQSLPPGYKRTSSGSMP